MLGFEDIKSFEVVSCVMQNFSETGLLLSEINPIGVTRNPGTRVTVDSLNRDHQDAVIRRSVSIQKAAENLEPDVPVGSQHGENAQELIRPDSSEGNNGLRKDSDKVVKGQET